MAAPTTPRVEATSMATTTVRWDYAGAADIAVFRSTDGLSYSEITVAPNARVAPGTTSYDDSGLSTGTKYWYKLSDDNGSTFSSVVTVITHSCSGPSSSPESALDLPRFDDDGNTVIPMFNEDPNIGGPIVQPESTNVVKFNELARKTEKIVQERTRKQSVCTACVEDGAVVIDCSNGCDNWSVDVADGEDVNSVSIAWCDQFDGSISFNLPPNATVGICGFPAGFGFSGDECTKAPITAGPNGRTVTAGFLGQGAGSGGSGSGGASGGSGSGSGAGGKADPGSTGSKPRVDSGIGSSGGGGGSGCSCVSQNGALTIKSCNAGNSLDCTSTKKLQLVACGGRGPYTWSKTGSVSLSATTGSTITVTPPANTGSAVAGIAFVKNLNSSGCGHIAGTIHDDFIIQAGYLCDDTPTPSGGGCGSFVAPVTIAYCFADPTCSCSVHSGHANNNFGVVSCTKLCPSPTCATAQAQGAVQDTRSGAMITAGCAPCALSEGATVKVTDAFGTEVTIIVRA